MNHKRWGHYVSFLIAVILWGSIGVFRRWMGDIPSGLLSHIRGITGALTIVLCSAAIGKPIAISRLKKHLRALLISGSLIGLNWILLFEAQMRTSVPIATMSYHMMPVIVLLTSPLVLGETMKWKCICCVLMGFTGMILVSGILDGGIHGPTGIVLGLSAACCYAGVILTNKKLSDVSATERTVAQLLIAGVTVFPYVLLKEPLLEIRFTALDWSLVLLLGVFHTGVAYLLYFSAMTELSANSIAVLSYLDPVVSILLSAILLGEILPPTGMIGSAMILLAAIISEYRPSTHKKQLLKHGGK